MGLAEILATKTCGDGGRERNKVWNYRWSRLRWLPRLHDWRLDQRFPRWATIEIRRDAVLKAICIKCGESKRHPLAVCKRCRFDPNSDRETQAKSIILSVVRFEDPEKWKPYSIKLEAIGKSIRSGQMPTFHDHDIKAVSFILEQIEKPIPWNAIIKLFLYFWPLWLIILLGTAMFVYRTFFRN
jgi:hypothetical protein